MPVIHGLSHAAIRYFHECPAALAVYWVYCSRTNKDNVAYPSLRGLVISTGWSINPVKEGREWLVQHGALERVEGYVRPEWRKLTDAQRRQRLAFDKSEYYRPTGVLIIQGKSALPLLYIPSSDAAPALEAPDQEADQPTNQGERVSPDDTRQADERVSRGETSHGVNHLPRDTELDSLIELDSIKAFELGSSSNGAATPSKEAVSAVFRLYENNIGLISQIVRDEILDALKEFPQAWIEDAIREAALHNKTNWKYIAAILKRRRDDSGKPQSPTASPKPTSNAAQAERAKQAAQLPDVVTQMFLAEQEKKNKAAGNPPANSPFPSFGSSPKKDKS